MDIVRIWNNESQLKALTGLSKLEMSEIMADFEEGLISRSNGARGSGGRPPKLDSKGIVLMLMMFYRHYLTLEAIAALFDLDDSNVKRWLDTSEEILYGVLEKKSLLHLIARSKGKKPENHFRGRARSISMALNSRSEGQL